MEDWVGKLLGVFALILVLLPPRWDPAIRIKEILEGLPRREPEDLRGPAWDARRREIALMEAIAAHAEAAEASVVIVDTLKDCLDKD